MTVETILRRKGTDVATIEPDASIRKAADWLRVKNIGALVVTSGKAVLGLISEREIVHAFSHYGETAASMPVKEVMRYGVITVSPDESVGRERRVVFFGSRYDFTYQRLEAAEELPAWLVPLAERVDAALPSGSIKHALCTEYDVGAGIGWHRDKKHFDQVFGLSLASACKFRFRRKAGSKRERFTLNAQPRSLYVMTGASRHVWEHSIPPVETRRYSITLRTMAQA
jgi:alkylated DNA repair dioxygenase AlkB